MHGLIDLPADLEPTAEALTHATSRVTDRISSALHSDLPQVNALCERLESYRGKMLRPVLTTLAATAAAGEHAPGSSPDVDTLAATVEAIHLATLVHDDVLDEADTRRGSPTISSLTTNETAVILGDYCIAAAYHLCSELHDREVALAVARCCMDTCAGEIVQLSERGNLALSEETYFRIITGKTAELIGASCRLGALLGSRDQAAASALHRFGIALGQAFQIQDDVLDLIGDEVSVGKTVGRDIAKGKLTLPMIHHLHALDTSSRAAAEHLLRAAAGDSDEAHDAAHTFATGLARTGSVEHARDTAIRLSREAVDALNVLPDTPARSMLTLMAEAAVTRDR